MFSQPEKRKNDGQNTINSLNNRFIPPTGKLGQFICQWAHRHMKTANRKGESSISPLEKAIEISNHPELRCTGLFY